MREERGNGSLFLSRCQCSAHEMRWLRDDRSSATALSPCQPTSHLPCCLPSLPGLPPRGHGAPDGRSQPYPHPPAAGAQLEAAHAPEQQTRSAPGPRQRPHCLWGWERGSTWARCGGIGTTCSVFCCVRIMSSHQPVAQGSASAVFSTSQPMRAASPGLELSANGLENICLHEATRARNLALWGLEQPVQMQKLGILKGRAKR